MRPPQAAGLQGMARGQCYTDGYRELTFRKSLYASLPLGEYTRLLLPVDFGAVIASMSFVAWCLPQLEWDLVLEEAYALAPLGLESPGLATILSARLQPIHKSQLESFLRIAICEEGKPLLYPCMK